MKTKGRFAILSALVLVASVQHTGAQGPLTPPGAPAPTMKTLQQIEPRVPITNINTVISAPGHYYLTGDLQQTSSAQTGIQIQSSDVTLDLMGFTLTGMAGGLQHGIAIFGARTNVLVRNGTVRGWQYNGIAAFSGYRCQFQDLRILQNGTTGLHAGGGSIITGCVAAENVFEGILATRLSRVSSCRAERNGSGIVCGDDAVVEDSVAFLNNRGISVGARSLVRNCAASENTGDGIVAAAESHVSQSVAHGNGANGIWAGPRSAVENVVAGTNQWSGVGVGAGSRVVSATVFRNREGVFAGAGSIVMQATASQNRSAGIVIGVGGRVTDSSAYLNNTNGIVAVEGASVVGNSAVSNAVNGILASGDTTLLNNECAYNLGAGIRTTSSKNNIEGNSLTRNGVGLRVDSFGSLITKNRAVSSTSGNNYNIAADNKVGVIVATPNSAAILGSTGGAGLGTTDPWANFSY